MANILMVGDTYTSVNMYYKTQYLSNNTFIYLNLAKGKEVVVLADAEYSKGLGQAQVDDIYAFSRFDYVKKIKRYGHKDLALLFLLKDVLDYFKVKKVLVPKEFPFFFGNGIIKLGTEVVVDCNLYVKERSIKTEEEIEHIEESQRACEAAMRQAEEVLKESVSKKNILYYQDQELTTLTLKLEIEKVLHERGCNTITTLVSCGEKGSDPHYEGLDIIEYGKPIMIDIFPYHRERRYFADMSRTFVKGDILDARSDKMYETVYKAQKRVISIIKSGVSVKELYNLACDTFNSLGYKTLREQSPFEPMLKKGFIHSLGHGVGLSLHEAPYVFNQDIKLETGNVITIEPGLYDPDIGGIRIEDIILVKEDGCRILSQYHKDFVIN